MPNTSLALPTGWYVLAISSPAIYAPAPLTTPRLKLSTELTRTTCESLRTSPYKNSIVSQ